MKPTFFVKQSTLRILYLRYKEYIIPGLIIGICTIIFFQVILPQIQDTLSLYAQVSQSRERINNINNNISFASKMDDAATTKDLQNALRALPQEKDFAGILDSISNAGLNSGVTLGDYSVSIGDISAPGAKTANSSSNLQLSLSIVGGAADIERFLISLKKQLPISNVVEVKIQNTNNASVTVAFYYRPFPKIDFVPSVPLEDLSKNDRDLLDTFSNIASPTF